MITNAIQVKPFDAADAPAWDQYVLAHPSGTVFHLWAWSRSVQTAYAHRPMHLAAWKDGQLVGVLPLFLVKSAMVGRVLVSVPYATYGGILAQSPGVSEAILDAARRQAGDSNARYVELRHREPNSLDLPESDRYDTFRKQLPQRVEDILPSLPRKTRAAARKGLEELTVEFGPSLLETIHGLYAYTLRRLGSPCYRMEFFRQLQQAYGDNCLCLVVKDGDEPVAGVISFVFRDEIVPYFSGSTAAGMRKNANNVMYLTLMEHAVRSGLRWFDFNRTRRDNHGPYDFKRFHGFEPSPLHYQFVLGRAGQLPNLSPSNPKYALAGWVWRRLPLWVTTRAGGCVTKWIP